jgi:glycopeptide antibiotics resistance protein
MSKGKLLRTVGLIAFAGYVITLLWASLNPEPIDGSGPIRQFVAWVLNQTAIDKTWHWLDYNNLEALANVALYIPLGVSLAVLLRKLPWWADALIGISVTASVELTQRLLLPDRFGTWADVLHNSLGVLIGVISARSIAALRSRIRARG